jgi:hypothetical protein
MHAPCARCARARRIANRISLVPEPYSTRVRTVSSSVSGLVDTEAVCAASRSSSEK